MDLAEQGTTSARHPWEVVRSEHFRRLISTACALDSVGRALDVGAGDGWFADEIARDLPVGATITCWDVNYEIDDLPHPTSPKVRMTRNEPDDLYDLVLLLDVLEHVDADEEFLADHVVPRLKPGATLVASVPAHPRLFSAHDTFLHHHRRYRPGEFIALLARHLDVTLHGSLFSSLAAARCVQVAAERAGHRPDQQGIGAWAHGPAVTAAVTTVLRVDARIGERLSRRRLAVPGLSHWAVCRLPTP